MSDEDKNVNVVINYKTVGADQAAQANQKYNAGLAETTRQYQSLRMAGRELLQVSTVFTLAGGLFTAGMVADANAYVKAVGQTTQLGAQWIDSENKIKGAAIEIGQTTANVMLPALQAGANLLEQVATIVQENPWIIQAALTVGTAMTVIGATTRIISEITRVIGDVGLLMGRAGINMAGGINAGGGVGSAEYAPGGPGGAGAGLGGILSFAAVSVASMTVGALIGENLGNDIAKMIYGPGYQQQNLGDALMTFTKITQLPFAALNKEVGILFPGLQNATNAVANFINQEDKLLGMGVGASSYKNAADEQQAQQAAMLANQKTAVGDFIAYQDQIQTATQTYEQNRADTITQYEQQIADTTATYEEQRANEIANFEQQQSQENARFALQQKEALQKHNLEMQQMAQNEQSKIADLADQRDALGLAKEQANYRLQVSQKDAQFNLDQQAQQANHDLQMQQNAQNEQTRLAQMDQQHKEEMQKMADQEKDRLQKMDDQYKQQIDDYQTNFVDKINAIDSNILGDTNSYTAYLANQAQQFQSWINNFQRQGSGNSIYTSNPGGWANPQTNYSGGPYQSGGYITMAGPGEDGRLEWMASNPTTNMLENLIGQTLTQQNVIAAVAAGRINQLSNNGHLINIVIQGQGMTVSQIVQIAQNALDVRLGDIIPALG